MGKSFFRVAWRANATRSAIDPIDFSFGGGEPAIGDFNGDGHQDILSTFVRWELGETHSTAPPGRQVLLLGRGDGTFSDGTSTLPDGGQLNALLRKFAVADFNGDGLDDIGMSLSWETSRSTADAQNIAAPQCVFLSGAGGLNKLDLDFTTWGHAFAAGDLNMDGRQDFIIGGFLESEGPGTSTAAFIQNVDGTLTRHWLVDRGGSSETIADFDLDGRAELIDVYADYNGNLLQEIGLRVTELTADGAIESETRYVDPFERLELGEGNVNYIIRKDSSGSEYIDIGIQELKVVDINEDGRPDIVGYRQTGTKVYENGVLHPGESHAVLEWHTLDGNGTLVPLSPTFSGWEDAGFQEFSFVDWNSDGHLDLFSNWEPNGPVHGPRIFLNDGAMHFSRLKQSLLPQGELDDGNVGFTPAAIDANGDGIMDIYLHIAGFDHSWAFWHQNSDLLYLGTKKFHTGPNYADPALRGAAGFNEQYYLNTYADAAKAVKKHKFDSGLDHYLEVGAKKGYFGFAANTHLFGSDKNDKIVAREGHEQLDGGLGNDTLLGKGGADEFVFSAKLGATNVDSIKDFKPGQGDEIALDHDIFKKIGGALEETEFFARNGATKAHDRNDRIVYDTKTGWLYYDDDGKKTGGHDAVHFATLSNKAALHFDDFIIV